MEFNVNELITVDKNTLKEAPKKGGRPKLKEKKEKRVMAYFTEKEYALLSKAAEESGHSISNFVRLAALRRTKDQQMKEPNINIERAVLSTIIFQPDLLDEIDLTEKDFYLPQHRDIFFAIQSIAERNDPIEEEFIKKELDSYGKLNEHTMLDIVSVSDQ